MKNKIIFKLTILLVLSLIFQSCGILYDKDTTGEVSEISYKPVITVLGEPIIEQQVGQTYVDAKISVEAGDNDVTWKIESGEVDSDTEGFYVVTYRAENQFGWASYAYRSVLIHDGTPYQNENIFGNYKKGFFFNASISKYEKNGYWLMSNVWTEEDVDFPIIFAEDSDGTLGVAPGVHPDKGRYRGTGVFTETQIEFTLIVTPLKGAEYSKTFTWTKL